MSQSPTPVHDAVREYYAERARSADSCCGTSCGCSNNLYDDSLISNLPSDIASFTLGCGDPITLATLQPGETVLDLGSGGGLDCFMAARQVGPSGHVIGVDMTPEMLAKARANAATLRVDAANVEFREGYLEKLPVEDASVDVVISNCVINLSPDKPQVFREVFRVLKPGGRVAVSDIVTNGPLPKAVQKSMEAWGACVAGALDMNDYVRGLSEAGFANVQVQPKSDTDKALASLPVGVPFSATVTARKPSPPGPLSQKETALFERGGAEGETIECLAPGGAEARLKDSEALLSRIVDMTPIADGYEFLLAGDPAESRALAEAFIRAEASCCSFLRFDLAEAPGGLRLRLTSSPAGIEFAKETFSQTGANVKWLS